MKRMSIVLILFVVLFPAFCSWQLKTEETYDEFGDVVGRNEYFINGQLYGFYSDKYVILLINEEKTDYAFGFVHFGDNGNKKNEDCTATLKIKELNGNVISYKCSASIESNGSYWECLVSIDSAIIQKIAKVFERNKYVKISVLYGKDSETYNYGTIDCSGFISSPKCMKLGHNYDKGVVSISPTCMTQGVRLFTCTNCGTTQTKEIAALGHNIVNRECSRCAVGHKGEAGGIIFYDCDADNEVGNPDGLKSSECGWRYLEAAPKDIEINGSDRFIFGCFKKAPEDDNRFVSGYIKYDKSNCTGTAVGTGKKNTELLVNAMESTAYSEPSGTKTTDKYAAKLCDDYSYGGYNDWFLPSINELDLMYKNLVANKLGNFQYSGYWSSSEYYNDAGEAWFEDFGSGYKYNWEYDYRYGRNAYERVRAIRSFK